VKRSVKDVIGSAALCMGIAVAAIEAKPFPSIIIELNDLMNQGRPRQMRMSKMFDAIELQIAISANPFRLTTMKLEMTSVREEIIESCIG